MYVTDDSYLTYIHRKNVLPCSDCASNLGIIQIPPALQAAK